MKKLLLSASAFALVAASSMVLAPSKAEAIPAFARQTGSACLACHFQEFPALAPYGRAFKEGSFTSVGDQALVEDDNLSIPSVLNATFVVRAQMIRTSGVSGNAAGTANGSSTAYVMPQDQNFLIAGRAGTNTGVFVEFGGGTGDTVNGGVNNMQVMNSFDVGGFKMGLSWADTSFGADSTLAVNSVYGQHSGNVGDLGGSVGAVNNSGFTNSIVGIGTWIGNDMGFIQAALVAPGGAAGWTNTVTTTAVINAAGGATNVGLKFAKLVKVAATLDVGGFDTIVGAGTVAGKVGKTTGTTTSQDMDMQWVYGQMQGDLGDMSLGVYADWAHAKGTANGNILGANDAVTNAGTTALFKNYNALLTGEKFDAYSIRATLEPVNRFTVGLGYGKRDTKGTAAQTVKHTVTAVTASYQFYQNMVMSLNYTSDKQSGGGLAATAIGTNKTTTLDYLIML